MAADQFCLRWNNFQINMTSSLESLKNDGDLVDVTLTCEGQTVKAHKVILSACSPYFRNVFRENPCQHPVVILKDVKYEDVTALLNFMYHGEVYIAQDKLSSFLHTAELLQVRGLTGAAKPYKDIQEQTPALQPMLLQQPQVKVKKSCVQPQSGQMRRVTSPLSDSLPAVPLITPVKLVKTPGSSLVSPPLKDANAVAKESVLCYGPVVELPAKSASPGVMTVQVLPLSKNVFTSNDQTSCSSRSPEQTASISPPSARPASFHISNSNSSNQLSQRFEIMNEPPQPSSPSATKRRKTLPRRFSNFKLSPGQIDSSFNKTEGSGELLQDSNETVEVETALKEVYVKVEEHTGNEMYNEEVESSSCLQENATDGDGSEFSQQKDDHFENRLLEQEVMEGERDALGTIPISQNTFQCSLGGKFRGISQNGSPSACSGASAKVTTLPHIPLCGACPHCGQTYSNQSALKYHVRLMHTDMTNRHCCHLCPRSFALREVYKTHMWSKHKQRC